MTKLSKDAINKALDKRLSSKEEYEKSEIVDVIRSEFILQQSTKKELVEVELDKNDKFNIKQPSDDIRTIVSSLIESNNNFIRYVFLNQLIKFLLLLPIFILIMYLFTLPFMNLEKNLQEEFYWREINIWINRTYMYMLYLPTALLTMYFLPTTIYKTRYNGIFSRLRTKGFNRFQLVLFYYFWFSVLLNSVFILNIIIISKFVLCPLLINNNVDVFDFSIIISKIDLGKLFLNFNLIIITFVSLGILIGHNLRFSRWIPIIAFSVIFILIFTGMWTNGTVEDGIMREYNFMVLLNGFIRVLPTTWLFNGMLSSYGDVFVGHLGHNDYPSSSTILLVGTTLAPVIPVIAFNSLFVDFRMVK